MITLRFDEGGERFILDVSEKLGRSPQDTVKCSMALLYWIFESVVKRGRTITLMDGSFDPYESVIVFPGDEVNKPLAKIFKFPTPEPKEE